MPITGDKYKFKIDNLEDIQVGKNIFGELIISNENDRIKTIEDVDVSFLPLKRMKVYYLSEDNKSGVYVFGNGLTNEEYANYIKYLDYLKFKKAK